MENSLSRAIAIVGMACRTPGADDLREFWQLVRSGGCAVGPLPPDRLNRELYFHPERGKVCKTYSDLGGIISARPFDPVKCPLPDELIEQVDVAHLTLCEVAAEACRDGGYDPFRMPNRNVGVFVGHTGGSPLVSHYLYSTIVGEGARALRSSATLRDLGMRPEEIESAVIGETRRRYPGRRRGQKLRLGALTGSELISEAFGLHGPYMVVDAACASSLQAMAVGVRSLLEGRLDAALVGGASYCKSDSLVLFSAAQSVSSKGTCPFSREADGLVASESYVVFLLKTVERAIQDGDRIQAVISGLGVSSDGRGKSLWAPRSEGQVLAVHRAYGDNLDPGRVQYIEAHATSTQVGDATELAALSDAFRPVVAKSGQKIPIGSVKGNIGHTLETAGVAGLVKTVLAMQHRTIPPAIYCRELNTDVDWETCPFRVPFQEAAWPEFADGHPRRAAVNSFGIGGLNVHVVVDEYQPREANKRSVAVGGLPAVKSADVVAEQEPIAVIGMGCVLPGAFTIQAFWELLAQGIDPKKPAPEDRIPSWAVSSGEPTTWTTYNHVGGFIQDWKYDWRRHKVPPKQIAQANPLQFMLLDAADQAFADAGINPAKLAGDLVAVIVGTMFGSDFSDQLQMGLRLPEFQATLRQVLQQRRVPADRIEKIEAEFQEELLKRMPALLDETGSFTSSTLASRITKSFNLMGGALALDAGECSGALALQAGVDMLRQGHAQMVVCAAGQRSMDLWLYEGLSLSENLSRGECASGLAANRQGFVPGEGCGVVILKRLRDAQRDGNPVRGVIRGVGVWSDDDHREAVHRASEAALRDAGLLPTAIMSVDTTCATSNETDQSELAGLVDVFGAAQRPQPALFGDLSHQFGQLGGGMAMAQVMKTVLATSSGNLPPTIGLHSPSPELRGQRGVSAANGVLPIPAVPGSDYRASVVSSVAGRMVYQLVLDNGAAVPAAARRPAAENAKVAPAVPRETAGRPFRLARFGAADLSQLLRQLESEKSLDAAFAPEREGQLASQTARCVVIADGAEELRKKLTLAVDFVAKNRVDSAADQGIFFRSAPSSGRTAFLFPGQGSQYPGMLKQLCESSPRVRGAKDQANAIMVRHGFPTFEELAWSENHRLGTDVWQTQVSMLLANWLMLEAALEAGWRADLVAGHSFGEFPALVAAGAWNLEDAILATRARCDAVARCGDTPTRMMSLAAPRSVVEQLLRTSGQPVYFCAENGPEQCVVGGVADAVAEFAEICQQQRLRLKTLQVPCAFHTPLLRASQQPLATALERREISSPKLPIVTSTFHRLLETPREIREALVAQMTGPVEFVRTIQKLRELGATQFLEIGPSQVLGQLTRRILVGDSEVRVAAMDATGKSHGTTLLRLKAAREAWGLSEMPSLPVAVAPAHPVMKFVDATERRRARLKAAASRGKPESTSTAPARREVAPSPSAPTPSAAPSRPVVPAQKVASTVTPATPAPAPTPVAKVAPPVPTKPDVSAPPSPSTSADALEAFLISFVVEQTGYPPEIVEMDADLEADLGIDSIKKAQLFGEIGNQFHLEADPNLSLDDFKTLRSVLVYLKQKGIGSAAGSQPAVNATPAAAPVVVASPPQPAAVATSPSAPVTQSTVTSSSVGMDLEKFLVNFVVEQTGYPPEIVEMDADLEADLGIDSIKKAQLFGEIGNQFHLEADPNLSLDDFSTLRSVLNYLNQKGIGAGASASPVSAKPAVSELEPVLVSPSAPTREISEPKAGLDLEAFLVNFVVEQTGYPPEIVELDADLEADLGIDSIKKAQLFGEIGNQFHLEADPNLSLDDFSTLRAVLRYLNDKGIGSAAVRPLTPASSSRSMESVVPAKDVPSPRASATPEEVAGPVAMVAIADAAVAVAVPQNTTADAEELASFLVNFVVEQTGYPPEIVELDADLEADLGIDSIKKAQLFGEIGNQFHLEADPNLSLDDFRTLRSVLDYLRGKGLGANKGTESSGGIVAEPVAAPTPASRAVEPVPASSIAHSQPASTPSVVNFDLEEFLVNFVVEQTGYPPEIVELDANLEADLGIDSIKKAQLFGEIGNRFHLEADPELSLDDFPTLREIRDYLQQKLSFQGDSDNGGNAPTEKPVAPRPSGAASSVSQSSAARPAEARPAVHHGEHFERGFAHGRHHLTTIRALLRARAAGAAGEGTSDVTWYDELTAAERDELAGIAAGTEVVLENLLALNSVLGTTVSPVAAAVSHLSLEGAAGLGVSSWSAVESPFCLEADSVSGRDVHLRVPGQLGGVAGWNRSGVAVAVREAAVAPNAPKPLRRPPASVLVSRILREATNLQDAAAIARKMPIAPGVTLQVTQVGSSEYLEIDANGVVERACPAPHLEGSLPQLQQRMEGTSAPSWVDLKPVGLGQLPTRQAAYWIVSPNGSWLRIQDNASRNNGQAKWEPLELPVSLPHVEKRRAAPPVSAPVGKITFPEGARITHRFVPRVVATESVGVGSNAAPRAAVVYGDGFDAEGVTSALASRGTRVTRIAESVSDAELETQLSAALAECPNPSLFLVLEQPNSLSTSAADWERDLQRRLMRPFRLCQNWVTRLNGAPNGAMLVAVTALGGQFGLASPVGSPWSGGLAGLCKGIRNENAAMRVKVIDVQSELPAESRAQHIVSEAIDGDAETEVGFPTSGRVVIRYEVPESPAASSYIPARGDQWVVTGGARGVTGVVAQELARRYGIELHLLGTTPIDGVNPDWEVASADELKALRGQTMIAAKREGKDPLQAWSAIEKSLEIRRQLRAMRDAGVSATYHVCDLSNWDALRGVLDQVRGRGPIRGIVHGAGFESAAKFEKKKLPLVERTLRAKVGGATALLALTVRDPLGWFIGFGSTSGRLGGVGQTDYSLANDMLAKQVDWLRASRPDCRATVFHWHAWDEIGMAARPESRFVLESFGLKFMPPKEGVAYLLTDVEAGLPESEVMITEDLLCPASMRVATKAVPPSPATLPASSTKAPVRAAAAVTSPLLNRLEECGAGEWVAQGILHPDSDPFLVQHRMFDRPVLPGVTGWEMLAQAVAMLGRKGSYVRLSQLEIGAGLRFATDDERRISVAVRESTDGMHAALTTQVGGHGSEPASRKEHVRGVVEFTDAAPHSTTAFVKPPFPYNPMVYPEGGAMYHGPAMRALDGLLFQHGGGWGKLKAPRQDGLAGSRSKDGWILPMSLLDGAIVGCAVFSWLMCGQRVEIPEGADELWLLREPRAGEACQLQFRFLRNNERHSWFDWELFGADGSLVMHCRGMRLVKLGQEETP